MDLARVEADRSIVTGSVSKAPPQRAADPIALSDEATVRNAVSSANLEELKGAPLSWANQDTGSRGTIGSISEYRDSGILCRRFSTSRESFDGVSLYAGDTCLGSNGAWWVRSFRPA